jgi:hypothetical protein
MQRLIVINSEEEVLNLKTALEDRYGDEELYFSIKPSEGTYTLGMENPNGSDTMRTMMVMEFIKGFRMLWTQLKGGDPDEDSSGEWRQSGGYIYLSQTHTAKDNVAPTDDQQRMVRDGLLRVLRVSGDKLEGWKRDGTWKEIKPGDPLRQSLREDRPLPADQQE